MEGGTPVRTPTWCGAAISHMRRHVRPRRGAAHVARPAARGACRRDPPPPPPPHVADPPSPRRASRGGRLHVKREYVEVERAEDDGIVDGVRRARDTYAARAGDQHMPAWD